jgi:drug/metabolite transporter (DMT)-like permease
MTRRGWLLFGALSIIWGVPYLLIKVTAGHVTPATLVFARTTIGGVLLLPIAIRRGAVRPVLRAWRPLLVYTAAEIAVPWFLLASAEERLSSSTSALVIAAVPLVGAVLARTTGDRERFGRTRGAGLLVGLIGVVVLVGFDVHRSDLGSIAEILVCAVGYAVGPWFFQRHLAELPSVGVVALSLLVAAIAYAPAGLIQAPNRLPAGHIVLAIVGLGIICTATAFLVFFALIGEAGPARATVITYVNPAVAVLLGVTILNESFTASTAAGFALILLGSVLATRPSGPSRTTEAREAAGIERDLRVLPPRSARNERVHPLAPPTPPR